jgi:fido (protein-threonine AMPylation protein)
MPAQAARIAIFIFTFFSLFVFNEQPYADSLHGVGWSCVRLGELLFRLGRQGMTEEVWEPIEGPIADEIEDLNRATLMNVAAALVKSLLARQARRGDGRPPIPDETALRLLHHAATLFLLAKPGRYRDRMVNVNENGVVVFQGAPRRNIKGLMRRFFRDLASLWATGDALDVASYALWRITWIHPFSNGNGRTAFAFSYACLCLKLGALLPGRETMVDLILAEPARCRAALRVADQGVAGSSGEPDLSATKAYLDELLLLQMQSVEADGSASRPSA